MHTPGKLVEFRDRQDVVRSVRWPSECIAPADAQLINALQYWESLRQGGLLPEPRAVDPIQLKSLLGWIHKVDTSDVDPNNYYFRLWGSNVTLEQFDSFKGLRISDYPSLPYRDAVMHDYRDVVATGVPTYQQVLASVRYRQYAYGRVILPLAEDGRRVTQLLVCVHERAPSTMSERVADGWFVRFDPTRLAESDDSRDRAPRLTVIPGGKTH